MTFFIIWLIAKSTSPTFHFEDDITTITSTTLVNNTQQQLSEKPKKSITKTHSINNLTVDSSSHFDGNDDDHNNKSATLTPLSRRHSHEPLSSRRRLGSSRRRHGSPSNHKKQNDDLDSGEELDDYNFMDEAKKQRSRSFNVRHNVCIHFYTLYFVSEISRKLELSKIWIVKNSNCQKNLNCQLKFSKSRNHNFKNLSKGLKQQSILIFMF